jgi:replicative DNA helicase
MTKDLSYGMVQPQDIVSEEAVLASCLTNEDTFMKAARILQPQDFYKYQHEIIFNSMVRLYIKSVKTDLLSVIADIKENNELEKIGGIHCLMEITRKYVGEIDIHFLCSKIKGCSIKRQAIRIATETIKKAFEDSTNGFDLASESVNAFEDIFIKSKGSSETTFADEVIKAAKSIKIQDDSYGVKTGFTSLDARIGSFMPQELIILAAGPGEGKTTYAFNIAKYVAQTQGGVLFFSLEMSKFEMALKYLSTETEQSVKDIRFNKFESLVDHALVSELLTKTQLHVYDQNIDSVDDIVSITKSEKKVKNIKLVVIDYLQLVPPGNSKKFGTREQEVSHVTRKLKKLAQDTGLPVIALSQVSRQKGRDTYSLSDLRESGAIEQDANTVAFIWRPAAHKLDYYTPMSGIEEPAGPTDAWIKIAKQRMGELDEWKVTFDGKASKFKDQIETKVFTQVEEFTKVEFTNDKPKVSNLNPDEIPF